MDGSGNVYVTGYSERAPTGFDYATIKYNAKGQQIWVKRYTGPGKCEDMANAIAVDGLGNAYVTGKSANSNEVHNCDIDYAYATVKY
jgi:hypothetical protein